MEVQRELSEIIRREIKDPRIHPMTTVVMCIPMGTASEAVLVFIII